jgi:hypothetical protein
VTLALLPDVERLVSSYLRARPDVTALVGDRVYTAFPAQASTDRPPAVLIRRTGGTPPFSIPLVVDEAEVQVDAYGGGKALAHEVVATVRVALAELEGAVRPEGVVAAVRFRALRYLPDEAFDPAWPRFIADVAITTRPARPAEAAYIPFAGVATTGATVS